MIEFLKAVWEFFTSTIKIAGPVIIILFVLALIVGLMNWTDKTKERIQIISANPILLFVWLALSIFLILMLYKYAAPLFS